jgi:hypothetical protein
MNFFEWFYMGVKEVGHSIVQEGGDSKLQDLGQSMARRNFMLLLC